MNKYSKEFLETLKQLCLEFDSKAESYPNPDYAGFALYYYATHPDYDLKPGYGGSIDIQTEFCEGGEDWIEELDTINGQTDDVKTLKLPENHFVLHMDEDQIEALIRSFFTHHVFTKKDLFKEESPDWLADTFILKGIDEINGVSGSVEIYPLDELYRIDQYTGMVLENKKKHQVIGMIIYRESIV